MTTQRIIGIGLATVLAGLAVWQATGGNWTATVAAGLGALSGFFPAVHKGAKP